MTRKVATTVILRRVGMHRRETRNREDEDSRESTVRQEKLANQATVGVPARLNAEWTGRKDRLDNRE
jgi:hypothetical protein